MWDAKGKIHELNRQSTHEYNEYVKKNNEMVREFSDKKDHYNNQINMINAEKIAMREELGVLYSFLEYVGGSLDRRVSIIDFQEELPAPNMKNELVDALDRVELFSDTDWGIGHMGNKKRARDFEKQLYWKDLDYKKNLSDKARMVKRMEDCEAIAKIYRDILTVIRDTIKTKVIPEFEYIRAFLIADAIRERLYAGYEMDDVKPCSIIEYKNTKYEMHYMFVKNTFDFLDLAKAFFSKRILTDLMMQSEITAQEKVEFEKSVYELQEQLILLEGSMEVGKNE